MLDWMRQRRQRRAFTAAHALGRRGEDLAHRYLQRRGLVVVARNFVPRSGHGDIDLVAREGERLVIVEVKTRTTADFGDPDRAVNIEKQKALLRSGREYARRSEIAWEMVRFDVVSVTLRPRLKIVHERDVFSLRDAGLH